MGREWMFRERYGKVDERMSLGWFGLGQEPDVVWVSEERVRSVLPQAWVVVAELGEMNSGQDRSRL